MSMGEASVSINRIDTPIRARLTAHARGRPTDRAEWFTRVIRRRNGPGRVVGRGDRKRGDNDVVPNDDVHPDLRRIARVAPRHLIGPRSLPIMRALDGLG